MDKMKIVKSIVGTVAAVGVTTVTGLALNNLIPNADTLKAIPKALSVIGAAVIGGMAGKAASNYTDGYLDEIGDAISEITGQAEE